MPKYVAQGGRSKVTPRNLATPLAGLNTVDSLQVFDQYLATRKNQDANHGSLDEIDVAKEDWTSHTENLS